MQNWIIGYGSLMDRASAERTLGEGLEMVPVLVPGYRRDFELSIMHPGHYRCARCHGGRAGVAAADAQPESESVMAAVAIAVNEVQLRAADRREVTYMRQQVMRPTMPSLEGLTWIYCGLPSARRGAKVLPAGYWQMIENAAQVHPYGEMIEGDRPDLEMADLELIRYSDAEPKGKCRCGRGPWSL